MKIIFENENLAVINKPANVLVHPVIPTPPRCGASFTSEVKDTIVDFIIKKYPKILKYKWEDKTRPGIVHRLDKDTSGLVLIAKNPQAQKFLQDQFKNHKIQKTYLALVLGKVEPKEGIIKTQISRDQKDRTTQKTTYFSYSWQKQKTRYAETHYRVLQNYYLSLVACRLSLLELHPKTGRMHQLRIHCQYLGHSIIGDQKYNTKESRKISIHFGLSRQFLHAQQLEFEFSNGTIKKFHSKLPRDLQKIICKLTVL